MEKLKNNRRGITLIALVITIVVLLILAGVSIAMITGDNGILSQTTDAKIETAVGALKEQIRLYQAEKRIEEKQMTPETLLAEGKVSRTVRENEKDTYYMYYALKEHAFEGMQGLGKGNFIDLKDVFLIDDDFNVKYIANNGKEYGDEIKEKILKDETEIRFASKAFSEYVSSISGISEDKMKFKWMKNQKNLTITDSDITTLADLVFFPNLDELTIGRSREETPQLVNLEGIENCSKLTKLTINYGPDKDYEALKYLSNLKRFYRGYGKDYNNIIDSLKFCENIEDVTIAYQETVGSMKRISELGNLISLNLTYNGITKIEGLEKMTNLNTLVLSKNEISKIEGLEKLKNLQKLHLDYNQITDILPLSINTSLRNLVLDHNEGINGDRSKYEGEKLDKLNKIGEILDRDGTIKLDVDKLGLFTNYKSLDLSNQNLTTLEPLKGLTELTSLNLSNNKLTLTDKESQDILASMTNLQMLDLSYNQITDIKACNNLTKLENLSLFGGTNKVNLKDIENIISNLKLRIASEDFKTILNCNVENITSLNLQYSFLKEIPDLSKFTKLKNLNLSINSDIKDFSNISKITSLENLYLATNNLHNKMIDFSKLTNLVNLDLSNNTLWDEDIESLRDLKNNKNLNIFLSKNALVNANALLELDPSTNIRLEGNVNLSEEAKKKLEGRFQDRVKF